MERRRSAGKRLISTQPHQSGELSLRPLTPHEDRARGMIGSIVATPAVLQDRFALTTAESTALAAALPWLHEHNPWYAAYRSTARAVQSVGDHLDGMVREGSLLPRMPQQSVDGAGGPLSENLHNDGG